MAARPGMWVQLSITASQPMLRSRLRRRLRSQLQLNQRRRMRQRPQPARRPEESYQRPGREPRSCCRRHSVRMQRQKRLKQVWSSSIDTPEILNEILRPSVLLGLHPSLRRDFRVFRRNFISLSYLFRDTCSAFNALESRVGLKVYSSHQVWRILYAGVESRRRCERIQSRSAL